MPAAVATAGAVGAPAVLHLTARRRAPPRPGAQPHRGAAQGCTAALPPRAAAAGASSAAEASTAADDAAVTKRPRTPRKAAAAAGAASEPAVAAPRRPRGRPPKFGLAGEKTADGRPLPDPRTVELLIGPGWFADADEVLKVLCRRRINNRYPYEMAKPATEWLQERLRDEPPRDGRCAAACAIYSGSNVLTREVASLQESWDWLQSEGLDAVKATRTNPHLLCQAVGTLAAKLDFMRDVMDLSVTQIDLAQPLSYSLRERMRPRFFYARQQGTELALSTLLKFSSPVFLGYARRETNAVAYPCSGADVEAYEAHIKSPEFIRYMDEEEARLRAQIARKRSALQ